MLDMKFSVVMSIYRLDDPRYLAEAIQSVVSQSIPPDEVILVIDGPISQSLNCVISKFSKSPIFNVIKLSVNVGPGLARHEGVVSAKNNIIAIMDSDDICRNMRFEKELQWMKELNIDVVGGLINEFQNIPEDISQVRKVPEKHAQIFSRGKWKMPVNHVTLMFRKDAYLHVGGYSDFRYAEDYDLIVRMLSKGFKFHNVQEVLVDVRIGNYAYDRRRGMSVLNNELKVIRNMLLIKYITFTQYVINIIIRVFTRIMPKYLISFLYIKLLRN